MKVLFLSGVLALVVLGGSSAYASANLALKLHRIDFQIDRAEIFAVNCILETKDGEATPSNCDEANQLVTKLNKKLDKLEGLNTSNNDEITQNIKLLRVKIAQVHDRLVHDTMAADDRKAHFIIDPSASSN